MNSITHPVGSETVGESERLVFLPAHADEMQVEDVQEGGLDIDFRAIWMIVYRNRYVIAAIIAVSLLLGVAVTLLSTPRYRALASVQIDDQASKVLDNQDLEPAVTAQDADRFLQTQLDVIQSRALAIRVAESLGLMRDDRFLLAMRQKPAEKPVGTLNLRDTRREQVLRLIEKNLTVTLPRNSRIVQIAFDSPDPVLAARLANSFAQNMIMSNLKRRFDTSSYARDFLSTQLTETRVKLETSEREMIAYARRARLVDTSAGAGDGQSSSPRSLTIASLVQLNDNYSQAQSVRVNAQERWERARSTALMNIPDVLANPAIQQLTQKQAELKADYEEQRQRRKADYPVMVQAAAQLAEMDSQINRLALSIKASIREQYLIALQQEQRLAGDVAGLMSRTLAEQDRSVQYNILKREVDTNRALYDGLLQRYKEVSATAGVTANNISVIDTAEPPAAPVSPRSVVNMALAGLGGLFLALAFAFARDRFDDSVRTPEDVGRKLGLPMLGNVPVLANGVGPSDALADPRSNFSEAYYALRTSIELASASGLPNTVLITSSRQSEGKTTSAYAIARDFARVGKKVLLIDGDLRKPSLHRHVGRANNNGFVSLLARQAQPQDVIQKTDIAGMDFISCGPLPPNPAELLGGATLAELLESLAAQYQFVMIDGPPILGLADAPTIASHVDATIFVIEANGAHHGAAKVALRRLAAARARLIGAILTKFDARSTGYGYDYGYYYSHEEEKGAA